jgi:hypothetical protein
MATAPKTAGSHDGIHSALIAALTAMGPVKKDANNPAYKSKYASLESVLETIEGPLHAAGLVFTQTFDVVGGEVLLVTTLTHAETEQAIVSKAPVRCQEPNNPQKLGGAITYMRRYSLLALLGLAPEDDDGNAASQPVKTPQARPRPVTAPSPPRQAPMAGETVQQEYARRLASAGTLGDLEKVAAEMRDAGVGTDELRAMFTNRRAAFYAAS